MPLAAGMALAETYVLGLMTESAGLTPPLLGCTRTHTQEVGCSATYA